MRTSTRLGIIALGIVLFSGAFLGLIRFQQAGRAPSNAPPAKPVNLLGKLDVRAADDLRVAGRRIRLCGVTVNAPAAIRDMVTDAIKREVQGIDVACAGVGAGTPCDGQLAAAPDGAVVVQCRDKDGRDIAALLVERRLFCGNPAQAGQAYPAC